MATGPSLWTVFRCSLVALALLMGLAAPAVADSADSLSARITALATGDFATKEAVIVELSAMGDPAAVPALRALGDGDLQIRKSDRKVIIAVRDGNALRAVDPVTGADLGAVEAGALDRVRVNNNLRRAVRAAVGSLTLLSKDVAVRRRAAESVFKSLDPTAL